MVSPSLCRCEVYMRDDNKISGWRSCTNARHYSASEMGLYISLFQFFYLSSFGSEIHISALLLSIYFLSEIHSSSIVSHNLPQIKI